MTLLILLSGEEIASSDLRPEVSDVAFLMPDRTTIQGGAEVGTFNDFTRPTGDQVRQIIDLVLFSIAPRVPNATIPSLNAARSIITLTAAILTEVTYFSHQGDVSEARIAAWQRLIEEYSLALFGDPNDDDGGAAENTLMAGTVRWSATDPSVYGIVSIDVAP